MVAKIIPKYCHFPAIKSSSTLEYEFLVVENNKYIVNIDKPCDPEFVSLFFYDILAQEPFLGGRLAEILVVFSK
jgi:hypothetical protein